MPSKPQTIELLTQISLASAACMPTVYFTNQIVAAPFYPGYSFSQQVASDLGTTHSLHPWLFNTGAKLTGLASIGGVFGLYRSFRAGNGRFFSTLIALCVAWSGCISFRAGLFPLPDPRHNSPGGSLTLIAPTLMLVGIWRESRATGTRAYLLFSALLMLPIVPVLKGKLTIPGLPGGTFQRILALATYVPIGVVGLFFLRQRRKRLAKTSS